MRRVSATRALSVPYFFLNPAKVFSNVGWLASVPKITLRVTPQTNASFGAKVARMFTYSIASLAVLAVFRREAKTVSTI